MMDPQVIIDELTPTMRKAMIRALGNQGVLSCSQINQWTLVARNLASGIYEGEEIGRPDYTRCLGTRLNEQGSIVAHEVLKTFFSETDQRRWGSCWTPAMACQHARRLAEARQSA